MKLKEISKIKAVGERIDDGNFKTRQQLLWGTYQKSCEFDVDQQSYYWYFEISEGYRGYRRLT